VLIPYRYFYRVFLSLFSIIPLNSPTSTALTKAEHDSQARQNMSRYALLHLMILTNLFM
jgi:hypothetical protein